MHRYILTAGIASLLVLPSSAQDGGKVKLEWKFKKGDTHRYEISTTLEVDMPRAPMSQEILLGLSMEVVEVNAEGTGTLKATFDRVRCKISFRTDAFDYDSDRDKKKLDDGFAARVLGSFVGRSMTMTLSRRGECLKVEGIDEILAGALKEFPDGMKKAAEGPKKSLSDDRTKGLMQTSLGCLPADPVGRGDGWNGASSISMGLLGKVDMKMEAALKELRAGNAEALIDSVTRVQLKVGDDGWPVPSLELLEGKMQSEMVWLVDRGLMQSSKGEMKFELSPMPNSPLISASIKQEMKLAPRKKDEPAKEGK